MIYHITHENIIFGRSKNSFFFNFNLWEIFIKYELKKLNLSGLTPEEFYEEVENSYYIPDSQNIGVDREKQPLKVEPHISANIV